MERKLYSIFLFIILLSVGAGELFAQREQTREVKVTGSYVTNANEAPAEAYAKALFNAKKQALIEAGVYENISSTAIIEIGGSGENFREINSELAHIELEGRVLVKKEKDTMRTQNGLYEYIVTIRADVKVEEAEEDPKFDFRTDGLLNTYYVGEKMTFTVTPTEKCYLRIFYFDPDTNVQLYPIKGTYKDIQFDEDKPVFFPLPNNLEYLDNDSSIPQEYTMELTDKNKSIEQGVLCVVALKRKIPFTKEVTYENVLNWLYHIERNQKRWYLYGVNIARRY